MTEKFKGEGEMMISDRTEILECGCHYLNGEEETAEQIEFTRGLLYLPVGSKVLMPFCDMGWYAHEFSI